MRRGREEEAGEKGRVRVKTRQKLGREQRRPRSGQRNRDSRRKNGRFGEAGVAEPSRRSAPESPPSPVTRHPALAGFPLERNGRFFKSGSFLPLQPSCAKAGRGSYKPFRGVRRSLLGMWRANI